MKKDNNFKFPKQCQKFLVLDTSVFSDPQSRKWLGKDISSSIGNFIKLASYARELQFFMPRSIKVELIKLAGTEFPMLDNSIQVRSPSIYELNIPAALFYTFLDDLRIRIDKGLRLTEELIREDNGLHQTEERIHKLREKYRSALRDGIVDSKEDFEVLLLAKEIEGTVVTADKGLTKYADMAGISILDAHNFPEFLFYEAQKYNSDLFGYIDKEN